MISTWDKFMNLNEQNLIIQHILSVSSQKIICLWQRLLRNLPNNIYNFCRRALILSLSNNSNLYRWKCAESPGCPHCDGYQTQLHVLAYCRLCLNRYKWRHDSILNTISHHISNKLKEGMKLFVDCDSLPFECPSVLFESQRPDIVVLSGNNITAIELTCCFEKNTTKSRTYKINRYADLNSQLLLPKRNLKLIYLEVTTLGFFTNDSRDFLEFLKSIEVDTERVTYKCMEAAARCSYYIFCRRNKDWSNPDLLEFY